MSEEELLLGQVSLALLGLSNALSVISLRTVRSSDGPELGLPIIFWAGPYSYFFKKHCRGVRAWSLYLCIYWARGPI